MGSTFSDFVGAEAMARVTGRDGLYSRLPSAGYTDKDFLRLEYRRWLAKTWLFVGRAHQIPNPGDAQPVLGHPFFLLRDRDGGIRAFHNACRHRGHALIDAPCSGLKRLTCPYHAWTYDLDGTLLGTPHFGGHKVHTVEGFDPGKHGHVPVRCGRWHDWIFINIDGEAPPLEDFVAPMAAKLTDVDLGRLTPFVTLDAGALDLNWKLAMENNMEPYHVPVVHKDTAAGQPLSAHRSLSEPPIMGCTVDIPGSDFTNRPGGNDLEALDMSARFLLRAPNFYLTTYAPDKVIDSMIVPDSRNPERCYAQHVWYTTSGTRPSEAEAALWYELEYEVLQEDLRVMRMVAKGLESVAVDDGGVLSPAWETCISAFYGELVQAMAD